MRTLVVCMSAALGASAPGCVAQEQRGGAADRPGLVGNWAGTADAGDVQLELRLVLAEEEGMVSATVNSLTRWNWETHRTERFSSLFGGPIVTVNGDTISVPLSDFEASYAGIWSQDGGRISGTFTQAGEIFELVLERTSEGKAPTRRPQTPEEPFPYLAEGVTYSNFASDALAGVEYLTTRDDIDPGKIGLAGQSEGGLVAPMAAIQSPDVSYILLLAGPGVNGQRIANAQMELRARANGASDEVVAEILERHTAIHEILKSETDHERSREAIEAIIRRQFENASVQERLLYRITDDTTLTKVVSERVQAVNTPWLRYFLTCEPAPTLEKVTVPVLAINGTRDLYVPHEENLREIEAALKRGGNTRYEIHALPGINHFLQHAETGTARESEMIEETVAVEVLELIADWITRVSGG